MSGERKQCVACSGSGKNARGKCPICKGTGEQKQYQCPKCKKLCSHSYCDSCGFITGEEVK